MDETPCNEHSAGWVSLWSLPSESESGLKESMFSIGPSPSLKVCVGEGGLGTDYSLHDSRDLLETRGFNGKPNFISSCRGLLERCNQPLNIHFLSQSGS